MIEATEPNFSRQGKNGPLRSRLSIPVPKFVENVVLSNSSIGCGEGYLIPERPIAPGRKPIGPDRDKTIWTGANRYPIAVFRPTAGCHHPKFSLVSWNNSRSYRSAGTGSHKESVKISAAGHAKSGDLSSIVDPKGSEQM
jgi:hypothetical protein